MAQVYWHAQQWVCWTNKRADQQILYEQAEEVRGLLGLRAGAWACARAKERVGVGVGAGAGEGERTFVSLVYVCLYMRKAGTSLRLLSPIRSIFSCIFISAFTSTRALDYSTSLPVLDSTNPVAEKLWCELASSPANMSAGREKKFALRSRKVHWLAPRLIYEFCLFHLFALSLFHSFT